MVVSNSQSKLLDLSLDQNLRISSSTDELAANDEHISLDNHSSVESEEDTHKAHESPFCVWYMGDEVWSSGACTREHGCDSGDGLGDSNSSEEPSDFDRTSSASPINTPSHKKRDQWRSPLTKRESLLEEAWERKRERYNQELANLQYRSDIRMLGRSASDCGKPTKDICDHAKHELLERSISDCSKPNKDPLITPNRLRRKRTRTRSLTDYDFEELQGCLDLGFGFDQSSIPDLCETLPALEAVCAVTQNFQEYLTSSPTQSSMPSATPSWRIISPGDDTEEVKEKLRHWAQATARLCY